MKDQVLSIEQMQKLKEIGIDTSKASMVLIYYDENENEVGWEVQDHGSDNPLLETYDSEYECWNSVRPEYLDAETGNYDRSYRDDCGVFTLQDIIELMPNSIEFDNQIYYLEIHKNGIEYTEYEKYESLYICNEDLILLNAYNMLVWLANHNYI